MIAPELCHGDLRRLLDLISALDEIRTLDEFPRCSVELLHHLLPADSYAYTEINPLLGRMQGIILPADLLTPADWEVLAAVGHEHPSRRQFRATALYRECYRHAGTEFQLTCAFPVPGPLVISLVFNRRHRDFDDRERQLVEQARPHLQRTYKRLELAVRMQVLQALLDDEDRYRGRGIILVSGLGVVMACNEQAVELCRRHMHCVLMAGDLLPAVFQHPGVAPRGGNQAAFRLERLPITGNAHGGYLLYLTERKPIDALGQLGLTPRQIEILSWITRGHSNKVIARRLGIAPGTVKKHLDQIYTRLDVDNRTAAVFRVHQLNGSAALPEPECGLKHL